MNKLRYGALVLFGAMPLASHAIGLGDYNVLVFQDFTSQADTEGSLAVGRDFHSTNYTVGVKLPNSNGAADSMVVGRNVDWAGSGTVNNGNLRYGGTDNFQNPWNPTLIGGARVHDTSLSTASFDAAKSSLTALSTSLSGLTTTTSAAIDYTLKGDGRYGVSLASSASGLVVFNVDGSKLSIADGLNISAANASTILINVSGTSNSFNSFGMSGGGSKVVFNLADTTSLSYTNFGMYGSLLAPKADIAGSGGQVNGQVVANSFSGSTQFNYLPFTGDLPAPSAVPEPTSMLALGAGALALLRKRRK